MRVMAASVVIQKFNMEVVHRRYEQRNRDLQDFYVHTVELPLFTKFGWNHTAASQILKTLQSRTEPKPNIHYIENPRSDRAANHGDDSGWR